MKVTGREGRGGNFFSECERSVDTNVRRGDIYYADLSPVVGSEQGGVRPVLIIQNDTGNRYSPTVIAAAITSQTNKAKLPTHIALSAPDYGLPRGAARADPHARQAAPARAHGARGRRADGAHRRGHRRELRPAKHTVGLTPPARTERVRAGEKMRNTA